MDLLVTQTCFASPLSSAWKDIICILCHTAHMKLNVTTYIPGTSLLHVCDARVKIILLAAYSITLFFVSTWWGLAACAIAFFALLLQSRMPVSKVFVLLLPLYFIVALTIIFNAFSADIAHVANVQGLGDVSTGVLGGLDPIALVGAFGFVPAGFVRGCFYGVRVLLLVAASLIVSFSTTSTELTDAFNDFLRPLKILKVPTDDVAMVFSLALRFIPVTAEELCRVYDAQLSRGASFSQGSIGRRLKAWQTVLIPLFVGLFQRADTLAVAMDARCYGVPGVARTSISRSRIGLWDILALIVGLGACATLIVFA